MKNAWVRWIVLIVGGLVAAALIGAGVLVYLVSRVDVRAEVERAVENATGRDLTIAGDVGVSFWPVLGLKAEDATLANVQGGRAPALAAIEEINIGVEIRPLLERNIVVRRLVLQHPRIALEVDAQGANNWNLTPPAGAPPPEPPPSTAPGQQTRFSLREVRTIDAEVSYFDVRSNAGWAIADADLSTALTSMEETVKVEGSLRYGDQPLQLDIEIAKPQDVLSGRGSNVKLDVESELLNASFEGQALTPESQLQGLINATGPSARRLSAWLGAPIEGGSGLEGFAVSGRINIANNAFDFANAAFAIDRLSGRGDFTLSQLRGKPYLSGRVEVFDFDLNSYLPGQETPAAVAEAPALPQAGAAESASAPTAEIAVVEAPRRAIDLEQAPSETPLDFSYLHAINADLEINTHAVLVQRMRIDRAVVSLVVNDGYLASTLHNVTLYGGSASGRMEIDARTADVKMVQDVRLHGVDALRFMSDAINFDNIEGRAELHLDTRAHGSTQSEMQSNLDGGIHIEVITGALRGVDLGGVSRTIRNALNGNLISPTARTPFNGFSASFAVANGVLASDNLSFNTPELRITGIGVIDSPQRRLDIRLAPRSARGGGIVIPFSVRGPWAQLAYTSDIRDIAQREIAARVREVEAASVEP